MNSKNTENIKLLEAHEKDYLAIKNLLKSVNLPLEGIEEHLNTFILLKKESKIIGTVGLEIYHDKALLRSLAVAGDYQGTGFGQKLYLAIIDKAREHGIREIYLLTETAEAFFMRQGFKRMSRDFVDAAVKESIEFRSACPASAVCMRFELK